MNAKKDMTVWITLLICYVIAYFILDSKTDTLPLLAIYLGGVFSISGIVSCMHINYLLNRVATLIEEYETTEVLKHWSCTQ